MIAGPHNHILLRRAVPEKRLAKEAPCFTNISRSLASCGVLNPQLSNLILTRLHKRSAPWVLPGNMPGTSFERLHICACGQGDNESRWRDSAKISFRAFAFTYHCANAQDPNAAGLRLSWLGPSGLSNICDGWVFCQP